MMRKQIVCAGRGIVGILVAGLIAATLPAAAANAADPSVLAARSPAPVAKKPLCASNRDMEGLDVRVLQTELMVAALTCDEKERYNRFITSYQPTLADRSNALRGYFRRAYGGQGEFHMNAFVTRMANDSSTQSWKIRDNYCGFANDLFEEVLNGNPRDINQIASKDWIKQRHGIPACQ